MSLRIAFCGPNLLINENLSHVVKDLLYTEDHEFHMLPHPMLRITEKTGWNPTKWDGHNIDWMNLWGATGRRIDLEATRDIDVVISATCGIDNVCLQATWLGEQMDRAKTGVRSLVDPQGNPLVGEEGIYVNRSGSVLQVILNSTEEEVNESWDYVYAVMPVGIEPDSERAPLLLQYGDFLATIPVFQDIVRLPEDTDAATDALKNEVDKWKKTLLDSS